MGWLDFLKPRRSPEDIAQRWARRHLTRNDYLGLAKAFTFRFGEEERGRGFEGSNIVNAKRALARKLLVEARPRSVEAVLVVFADSDAWKQPLADLLCELDDPRAVPALQPLQEANKFSAEPSTRDRVFDFLKRHTGVDAKATCLHDWKLTGARNDRFYLCGKCGLNWEVGDEHHRPAVGSKAADRAGTSGVSPRCADCDQDLGVDWCYGFESILLGQPHGSQCKRCGVFYCSNHDHFDTSGNYCCPKCASRMESLSRGQPYQSMVEGAIRDGQYLGPLQQPAVLGRRIVTEDV